MSKENASKAEKAIKRIRNAGIAGCVLAFLTGIQFAFPSAGFSPATIISAILHASREGNHMADFSLLGLSPFILFNLLSIIIVAGLTIGVYKKNELGSILLFIYGSFTLVAALPTAIGFFGIPTIIIGVILFFLFFGMIGTFDYHHLKNKEARTSTST